MGDDAVIGATVGVIGGGQLGRMMAEAAGPLGVDLHVLDPTPSAPAAPVSATQTVAAFDDREAIADLATQVDVLTYEIELADPDVLADISEQTGTPVHPAPETLRMIQDKLEQNRRLEAAGIPIAPYRRVDSVVDLELACEELGYPAMVKARSGGYDGRGNAPVSGPEDLEAALASLGDAPAIVEAHVAFVRELSVIGVQGVDTQRLYAAGENIHEAEILRETVVPARAPDSVLEKARAVATEVLTMLDGRGVFGIELFETRDGEILVNEIAPRPHNSGHWTIEGAKTSQFEQHVRAVLGAPLGSTAQRCPIVTANLLGAVESPQPVSPDSVAPLLSESDVSLHWYGKHEVRPLRKMGHFAVYDGPHKSRNELLDRARNLVVANPVQ